MLAVSLIHDFATTACKWMLGVANPVPGLSGGWRIKIIFKSYVCKLCPFPWWAHDGPIRSLICVVWEYENDRRYPERNRIQNNIFHLQFLAGRNCLVSSCRIPKKIIPMFPCTFHSIPIRIVRLRPNEN